MKPWIWGRGEIAGISVSPRVGSRRRDWLGTVPSDEAPVRNIRAEKNVRFRGRRVGIDITWLEDRIAVGGGIWDSPEKMAEVARAGITHIIDMQIEWDDTELAKPHGIEVCWIPVDDDFKEKPPEVFEKGVEFAESVLEDDGAKLFIHCAAGVHRAPMMALALLAVRRRTLGQTPEQAMEDAMDLIESKRAAADFADVYVCSVREFLNKRGQRRV